MTPQSTSMQVITNYVPRDVIDWHDLTAAERAEFDYLDSVKLDAEEYSSSFFRYRGRVYDLGEFMAVEPGGDLAKAKWDGFSADTYFSAVVVRYVENGERIICGLALS